jgi:hypothetical protein
VVRHLEAFGLRRVYSGDIRVGQDALAVDSYGAADASLTNPPYTRDVMHRLIAHFQRSAPTWLLLELDWASTRQATPFMPSCSDILAIGRVKWIEDSKHTGKDNCGWFRFDTRHASGPVFHGPRPGRSHPCTAQGMFWQKNINKIRAKSDLCPPLCRDPLRPRFFNNLSGEAR